MQVSKIQSFENASFFQATWRTGKKLYASEDGSTYGDAAGGLQRVYDIHQEHIVSLSQGSNFWNPWSGYYPVR